LASEAGLRHLVLLSGRGEQGAEGSMKFETIIALPFTVAALGAFDTDTGGRWWRARHGDDAASRGIVPARCCRGYSVAVVRKLTR
jgi:hypothetical protein